MDWDLAIKRNSEALKGIIADLFAMLEFAGLATVARLPRSVHSAVLRVLRPAESAVRRLIVIAARDLVVKLAPSRPISPPKPAKPTAKGLGSSRPPSFKLFDARKNFPELRQHRVKYAKNPPRILFFGDNSRVDDLWIRPAPSPAKTPLSDDALVNAVPLTRRLEALKLALEGPPPGRRRKPTHLVDEVLIECHGLAWDALKPDTS